MELLMSLAKFFGHLLFIIEPSLYNLDKLQVDKKALIMSNESSCARLSFKIYVRIIRSTILFKN